MVSNIYCEYPFRLETMLHNKFNHKRANGEWFYLEQEDISNFKTICEETIQMINVMKDNLFFSKDLK